MGETADEIGRKRDEVGRKADASEGLDHVVRFGTVVYGLVHLVIGWLALQLALGDGSQEASGSGAMQELAQQPLGSVVLWLVAAGMLLLALWRLLEAVTGHRDEDGFDLWKGRASDLLKVAIYGVLCYTAVNAVAGSSSGSGSSSEDTLSAMVMGWPGGQWLVAAVGLAVIGYGGRLVHAGLTEKFLEDLGADGKTGRDGQLYRNLGKVGHVAKGVAIGLVGSLFVFAGVTHDADKSGGLDEALTTVLEQPFGSYMLGAIAVGIGCFGVFCFAQARHLSR